ncbi:hypothetical protein Pcinc_017938 [Petrolisthes cinctipes]|uniref:Major facilitator superfamily (MFS) profile domain-containing protein n=1 Tax=Petrolisthes cinctipes TaxID=88211 RepID=A0AAE1FT87_PETCI|nr:hypothetical protein Pcinc_017938 [Petrolisthes cinctipes]
MTSDSKVTTPKTAEGTDEVRQSEPPNFNSSDGCEEDLRQPEAGADEMQLKESQDLNYPGCEDDLRKSKAGADNKQHHEPPNDLVSPGCEDRGQPNTSGAKSSDQPAPAIPDTSHDDINPEEKQNIKAKIRRNVSIAEVPPFIYYYDEKIVESDEQRSVEKRPSLTSTLSKIGSQCLASLVMAQMRLASGLAFGFTGYVLPQLTRLQITGGDGDIFLPSHWVALFGSLVYLGAAVGTCCSELLLSRLGQRTLLMLCTPVAALTWLLVYFSPYAWIILLTQFILGITGAIILPCTQTYILETVHEGTRERLTAIMHIAGSAGIILPFIIGTSHIGWRELALICCGLTLLPALGIFFLPHSPRWLITCGRNLEALMALTFFRGDHLISELELSTTFAQIQADNAISTVQKIKHLFKPPTVQPFAQLIITTLTVAFSGGYTILAYFLLLLQNLETGIHPNNTAVMLSLMGTTGIIVYFCIKHRLSHKPLLVAAFSVAAASFMAFAGYMYFLSIGSIMVTEWVPVVCLLPYAFSLRMGEAAFSNVRKELLNVSLRKIGLQFLTVILYLAAFVVCCLYPMMAEAIGPAGVIFIFSAGCAATATIYNLILPETKNHTPQPITLNTTTEETTDDTVITTISTHL